MDAKQTLEMLQRELVVTNSAIANMRFFPLLYGEQKQW